MEATVKKRRTAITIRERYGEDFYSNIGTKGGSKPTNRPKGFAANPRLARQAGKLGGKISTRKGIKNKKVKHDE